MAAPALDLADDAHDGEHFDLRGSFENDGGKSGLAE